MTSPFRSAQLSNGLTVIVAPQAHLHRVHVAFYVRVGSRYETSATNGLSHFLEHMMYRGTEALPTAHQVNHAFETLGGYLYAATQTDSGVFSVTAPKESLDPAAQLFAEVLLRPAFNDIDIEKDIVCEEILEDLDDEGRQVDADNLSRQLIYPSHPLGFTITGDASRVRSFSRAMLIAHHARHYNAANSVLVFSGAVTEDDCIAIASRYFSALPKGEYLVAEAPIHKQKRPRARVVENASSQTELRVCLRAVPQSPDHQPIMDMLLRIIDDGMSTRLYHRICDSKGLCYDVSAGFDGYEDDGIVDFAAGVQHARTSQVAKEVLHLMADLATQGPTDAELTKARKRHAWEMAALRDSPEDFANFFGLGALFRRLETPDERLARSASVSARELQEVAALLAQPERLNVLAVGLLDDAEEAKLRALVRSYAGPS